MALQRWKNNLRNVFLAITIEPMLFLKDTAMCNMNVISENLKLDRFCRVRLNYTEDVCRLMNDGNHNDVLIEVQKLDNVFGLYQNIVSTVIPVLMLSFVASWSDERGRKVPIMMSIFGNLMGAAIYLLVSFFPSWPPEILYAASFLESIGGGWVLFYMASYSYIADNSKSKSRTARLAIMRAIWCFGAPAGTAIGAVIYDTAGFSAVFGLSLCLYIVCLIYSAIVIKDKEKKSAEAREISNKRRVYNPMNILDLFKTNFRRRPARGRLHILGFISLMIACLLSNKHNMYLWSMRVLNWDSDCYSLYSTISSIVETLMVLFTAPLLLILKLNDCILGTLVSLLTFARGIAFGLVTKTNQAWVPYMFIIIPTEYNSITIRSSLSKVCNREEIGRVFSLLGVFEVFWPVVDSAIFTAVYGATIEYYPSFEHFVSATFAACLVAGFLGLKHSMEGVEIRAMERRVKAMGNDKEKAN